MAIDQQRLSEGDRANLVAYLDGELSEAEARVFESKMTASLTTKREIELLRKTWEMLDLLNRPAAGEMFATRTISLIQEKAHDEERRLRRAGSTFRNAGLISAWIAGGLVAACLGFVLTRYVWPDPSGRLARDLTLFENLDGYREIGRFEFLRILDTDFDESLP